MLKKTALFLHEGFPYPKNEVFENIGSTQEVGKNNKKREQMTVPCSWIKRDRKTYTDNNICGQNAFMREKQRRERNAKCLGLK